jgi:hypothetical protein
VKLDKLGKKLRREIAASPKKAALLGLITVVALYFWAPLVRSWLSKDKTTAYAEPTPAASAGPLAAQPGAPSAVADAALGLPSWERVVQWMHDDPRTMTATRIAQTRDPFECPKAEVSKAKADETSEPHSPMVSPSAAGLVLTATIIGSQRPLAQISGKTYAVGQTIEIAKEKETVRAAFMLTEIHPRRAVLQSGGEKFELMIPEPGRSGKIELLVPNR